MARTLPNNEEFSVYADTVGARIDLVILIYNAGLFNCLAHSLPVNSNPRTDIRPRLTPLSR